MCVGEDLQDCQSDLHRICLALVESIDLESKMVVFRTSPATTRDFLSIETRGCSRANISGTAHRISSKFNLSSCDLLTRFSKVWNCPDDTHKLMISADNVVVVEILDILKAHLCISFLDTV